MANGGNSGTRRTKANFPESVRNLPIPEFPHSPDYKEPLPRAVHADREKFRAALIMNYQAGLNAGSLADAATLGSLGGAAEIPTMIGLIASDNTYNSVYNIGYFGLTPLTGIKYSALHDGNWWKLWWEKRKETLPETIRNTPLPEFPRSAHYREPIPVELHRDPDKLRETFMRDFRAALTVFTDESKGAPFFEASQRLVDLNDPRPVPEIIELLPEKNNEKDQKLSYLDSYLLPKLTGVSSPDTKGGAWWRNWWKENRTAFEKRYPTTKPAPDFETLPYRPGSRQEPVMVADCPYDPQVSPGANGVAEENPEEIADTPSVRHFAGGDKNKLYRLVGFDPKATAPNGGYSLLVILPGGDGSEEFRWFIRRIKKYALPKEMLVAELVAPEWSEWQAQSLVWPTRKNPFFGMKFSTEEFIEATIADVKRQTKIAPARVYTMAWSSSGPAVYTHLATKGASVAGAFIAMSVFRPNELPAPDSLNGKRVSLYHSPQDFIKIQMARDGETYLKAHGATVRIEKLGRLFPPRILAKS